MPQQRSHPSSASTSLTDVVTGPVRTGTVIAAGPLAAYVSVPQDQHCELVFALLLPGAVRLPIGVCVGEGPLPAFGEPIEVGDGLVVSATRTWRPVRWWDARAHLDASGLVARADVLAEVLHAEPRSSFGLPLGGALRVAAALAAADERPAYDVLGLGPGLTPAGDDVVAGALAVLETVGRLDDSVRVAVAARARTRTTALSAALVAAAGRGEMIPQAARLLTSVAAGEPRERVAAAARDLFAVGSSSGHDLAAGLSGALQAVAA